MTTAGVRAHRGARPLYRRQEAGVQLLEYECCACAEEDLAAGARPEETR